MRSTVRHLHGTFTTIYSVIALFWLGAPAICINYESIFQSGLMNFFLCVTCFMIGSTILSKEAIRNGTKREFVITYRHTFAIIFSAAACIYFSSYYVNNLITMLLMCPSFLPNTTTTTTTTPIGSNLSHSEIELQVKYQSRTQQQRILLAKYLRDEETGAIIREKVTPSSSALSSKSVVSSLNRLPAPDERRSAYSQLEYEAQHLIALQEKRFKSKSLSAATSGLTAASTPDIETTSLAEDITFQELRARKVCRNEQSFAIGLVILIIITMILNLLVIGFYIWIRTLV